MSTHQLQIFVAMIIACKIAKCTRLSVLVLLKNLLEQVCVQNYGIFHAFFCNMMTVVLDNQEFVISLKLIKNLYIIHM